MYSAFEIKEQDEKEEKQTNEMLTFILIIYGNSSVS